MIMHDKQILVFHEKLFQVPVPFQYWEMIENAAILCFLRTIEYVRGYRRNQVEFQCGLCLWRGDQ